jgi:phospholipase/lecithinase/hemolysin
MIRALLALALAFAATAPLAAPRVTHVDPPHHVLFIGNSFSYYNDSLHGHLRHLVLAAEPEHAKEYVFRSSTISGAYLMEHAGDLPYELQSRHWDVVVLQGQSREPMAKDAAKAERFRQAARGFDGLIRASGAKTVFFMTWAYQGKPAMTEPLAKGYEAVANELDDLVVPVGLAFQRSLEERPALVLHFKDHMHPSLAGTYLAACTFYAALYGKSPEGNPYTADLDPDTARFLQAVAWRTVRGYYGEAVR